MTPALAALLPYLAVAGLLSLAAAVSLAPPPTPSPTDPAPPTGAPRMKIGDLLVSKKTADSDKSAKLDALKAANDALAASSAAADAADVAFTGALKSVGPVVDVTTLTIYDSPDGVQLHTTQAVSLDADVPAPAPMPAPEPAPEPTPAPATS